MSVIECLIPVDVVTYSTKSEFIDILKDNGFKFDGAEVPEPLGLIETMKVHETLDFCYRQTILDQKRVKNNGT